MAAAHWLCAVEFGSHAQAVAVGVGNAVWSHFAREGSTQLPRSDSFRNNRSFFNGKDAVQISIRSLAYSASGAVRP